jgi:hypothetical protein
MTKKQESFIKKISLIGSILCYGVSSYILGGFDQKKDLFKPLILKKDSGSFIVYKKDRGEGGSIVASKSGKKYYFPWCSGINRIKEENRVYFSDEQSAQERGLTLSKTCD